MSHIDRLSQGSIDPIAFRDRVLELWKEHSPTAIVDSLVDRAPFVPEGFRLALRVRISGGNLDRPTDENTYLMVLANQALNIKIKQTKKMQELPNNLKHNYKEFQRTLLSALRQETIEVEGEERLVPTLEVLRMSVQGNLSSEDIDHLLITDANSYIKMFQNAVEAAKKEFGIEGKGRRQ